MKKSLFAILIMLTGCAGNAGWNKDGADHQAFIRDYDTCRAQGRQNPEWHYVQLYIAFNECMRSAGWHNSTG